MPPHDASICPALQCAAPVSHILVAKGTVRDGIWLLLCSENGNHYDYKSGKLITASNLPMDIALTNLQVGRCWTQQTPPLSSNDIFYYRLRGDSAESLGKLWKGLRLCQGQTMQHTGWCLQVLGCTSEIRVGEMFSSPFPPDTFVPSKTERFRFENTQLWRSSIDIWNVRQCCITHLLWEFSTSQKTIRKFKESENALPLRWRPWIVNFEPHTLHVPHRREFSKHTWCLRALPLGKRFCGMQEIPNVSSLNGCQVPQ